MLAAVAAAAGLLNTRLVKEAMLRRAQELRESAPKI
jgi:hypothetical protein